MEIIHLVSHLSERLGPYALVAGLVFAAVEYRHHRKAQRISNMLAFNQHHRDIWSLFLKYPSVERVLKPEADVSEQPVTAQESIFVTFLILHLSASFKASEQGMYPAPQGRGPDVLQFFALPLPRKVWETSRLMQDEDFATFVESALEKGDKGSEGQK
jgi:hypothetical protein